MKTAKRLLLVGDQPLTYLLRDDFITADAAPITSPRTSEPGPGTGTYVQTDGTQAISGGAMQFTAQSTPVWGDQGRHDEARTRSAGLALFSKVSLSTWEECGFGWHTAAAVVDPDSMEHALQAHTTDGRLDNHNATQLITGLSTGTEYILAQVLRSTGCWQGYWNGSAWKTLRIDDAGATATLYPVFANLDGAGSIDSLHVVNLPANGYTIWGNDYGIATDRKAGSVAGSTTFTHEADCLLEFEATTLPSSNTVQVRVREKDSSNYWYVLITSDGTLRLREVVATVDTARITAAAALSGGERIMLVADGNVYSLYYDGALAGTYTDSNNYFLTETAGRVASLGTDGAISDLITWPRTLPAGGYGLTRAAS